MAAEARAMLDALMGSDRNADIPKSGGHNLERKKKSCYDYNICPFYCAWGVDVYALFTNTKSDLGPNPNIVHDDAREEFLSLPSHEQERLGYEFMLYQKLRDLVRGCDRIVNRNLEKLRVEKAQAAKARGKAGRSIDPATDVTEEMLLEAANLTADLELREEEVANMLTQLIEYDHQWKLLWDQLQQLQKIQEEGKELTGNDEKKKSQDVDDENVVTYDTPSTTQNIDKSNGDLDSDTTSESRNKSEIQQIKTKLYKISADQQKLISSLSTLTSQTVVPLRDNLQNINKQLYYVKTDTSSDKSVCEVSGNTMSSRDAEERIAAHYAGKQYVGWKMVRDKLKELQKKYAHVGPGGGGGGPVGYGGPPYGSRYGGPPPPGYGNGGPRGGPPMQNGGYRGGQPQYGRFQDRDYGRDNNRGGDRSRSRNQRKRSPSPSRWQRDQGYHGGRR